MDLTEEQLASLDKRIMRLVKERDAAIHLAEQAEQKYRETSQEHEKATEEGYAEAFQMVDDMRTKMETLKQEKDELEKVNKHLLEAAKMEKSLAESLIKENEAILTSERKILTQEFADIQDQCDRRVKDAKDKIVTTLDTFLKEKYEEITLEEVKKLKEKGGKALVIEAMGEEGVKLIEEVEARQKERENFNAARTEEKLEAARMVRAQAQKAKTIGSPPGSWYAPASRGKMTIVGGGMPGNFSSGIYKQRSIGEDQADRSVEDRVKEIVDVLLGEKPPEADHDGLTAEDADMTTFCSSYRSPQ